VLFRSGRSEAENRDPGETMQRFIPWVPERCRVRETWVQAALVSNSAVSVANAHSIHGVSAATSEASIVAPHQMRRPGGAARYEAASNATPSFSSKDASFLANSACTSSLSAVTRGSTTLRHTLVFERVAGSSARKSIHGVFS